MTEGSVTTKSRWGWWVFLGIVLLILGVMALGSVAFTSALSIMLIGWLFVIVGVVQFFSIFFIKQGRLSTALLGVLYFFIGLLIINNPGASLSFLTLMLGIVWTIAGITRTVSAASGPPPKGWRIFGGIVTLLLGLMIWVGWPEASLVVFGLFVGIDLIFGGIAAIVMGFSSRKLASEMSSPEGV